MPSILRRQFHLAQSLSYTTSTLRTAFAPTTPSRQFAIDLTWRIIAASHRRQRQALGTSIGMSENTASQLLLAARALLRAFFWIPFGNFAILEEACVSIAFQLVQFTTNLFQCTQLRLKVDVVSAACLHLFQQISIQLCILCIRLAGYLSRICFFLGCCSELCLRIGQHVLVILDLSLQRLLGLFTIMLQSADFLEELIALIFDACLDQQESRLQFVALRRFLNCTFSCTFVCS
mmetsp:Transcript_94804/g.149337  ORF Transcript_94804/g.149337 Transcript_94804/m.149337 type:complete len:234 (-) Transcript_94804:1104-1805(-)